jgi:hypothetical protein
VKVSIAPFNSDLLRTMITSHHLSKSNKATPFHMSHSIHPVIIRDPAITPKIFVIARCHSMMITQSFSGLPRGGASFKMSVFSFAFKCLIRHTTPNVRPNCLITLRPQGPLDHCNIYILKVALLFIHVSILPSLALASCYVNEL